MSRTQVANLVTGVTDGFKKELEINGVGYRAQMQGNVLKLSLGYSHDVEFKVPEGITVTAPKPTEVIVEGIDPAITNRSSTTQRPRANIPLSLNLSGSGNLIAC